jgi:hypothetical protein
MRGAIPPLPNTPSWRGAQLKHRGSFTFTSCVCVCVCMCVCKTECSKNTTPGIYDVHNEIMETNSDNSRSYSVSKLSPLHITKHYDA